MNKYGLFEGETMKGFHIVVSKHAETGDWTVERVEGTLWEGPTLGLVPGLDRGPSRKIIHVEFTAESDRARRRAAWFRSAEGRKVLEAVLEADARGECRCEELLFPDKRNAPFRLDLAPPSWFYGN